MIKRILVCLLVLFFSLTWGAIAEVPKEQGHLQEKKIILQREYLDGELSEEKVTEVFRKIEDLQKKYKDWEIVEQTKEQIVLHKTENDISPLLKANGYFGITDDGTLSIFIGRPQYEKIIHTFFQIDVGRLEVYKQEELHRGIPINNKEQFYSLIKEYKEYSVVH